jgi:hypothetical protein
MTSSLFCLTILTLTYIYNPLSADPTLARHVVYKLQRLALKMSVFSYRMEPVMGELNYWTDHIKRWTVGWIAGSENKAHGKMASLFAQPYVSPPDYDTVEFLSMKEILLSEKVGPTQRTLTKVNHKGTQTIKLIHDLPQTRCVLPCLVKSSCSEPGDMCVCFVLSADLYYQVRQACRRYTSLLTGALVNQL